MALFYLVFFRVSSQTVAVYSPKSGNLSAETPYLDVELLFSQTTAIKVEMQSQKWFLYFVQWSIVGETTETVASNFIPHTKCC